MIIVGWNQKTPLNPFSPGYSHLAKMGLGGVFTVKPKRPLSIFKQSPIRNPQASPGKTKAVNTLNNKGGILKKMLMVDDNWWLGST